MAVPDARDRQFLNEVMKIKRSILFFLSALTLTVLFMAPVKAEAADMESKAGAVTTSSGRLNVRSAASTGASVVTSLSKGSYVTLISKSGSWWRVEYAKGKYGYCHEDYITVVSGSPAAVQTQSGALNVRSGPGTSYAKTGSLAKGETVLVLSTASGWSRVLYHGTKTGYVSAQYLSSNYAAVSLNVPDFKQTDSRWGDMLIGQSGKTMSQIGCATTAIAMMESFRTGTTIYPDAMAGKLTYTASGSVYWPGNYTAVTSSSGYLKAVYELLRQGKPVLFGAKNSAGKQHWVVITGFTGGAALDAESFTIHDPGTYSRKNLQQFLAAFPTFYKYFYY